MGWSPGRGDPTMVQDKLLSEMRSVALSPDVITYTSLVQNCASQILSRGSWVRLTLPCEPVDLDTLW